jgi:hypothetical protein
MIYQKSEPNNSLLRIFAGNVACMERRLLEQRICRLLGKEGLAVTGIDYMGYTMFVNEESVTSVVCLFNLNLVPVCLSVCLFSYHYTFRVHPLRMLVEE